MALSKTRNPWIAGLCSFAIHLALLVIMAIWTIRGTGRGNRVAIQSGIATDPERLDVFVVEVTGDAASETALGPDLSNIATNIAIVESTALSPLSIEPGNFSQSSAPLSSALRLSGNQGEGIAFASSSLEGRSPKNRAASGIRNGSTPESEAAVEAALAYLARHQRNNGSWTSHFIDSPCNGECQHSGADKDPHEIAATGLALLCFLGAGHTMHSGEYSEQVNKGIYFLVQSLRIQSGRGTWLTHVARAEMYEHGIATLALCEALQMTQDDGIKDSCQAAINHIVYAQHSDGGWDYHPKAPGDLSIVGWQVMALKSAVSGKLAVGQEVIRGIDVFVKRNAVGPYMFSYRGSKPTACMTAIGNLIRIFRGWSRTDPALLRASEYLIKQGPSEWDVYSNYYASQFLFQMGGQDWKNWDDPLRDFLVRTQEQEGHMAGSWWFQAKADPAASNSAGGRLYVTAMACLTLEVYYRYLPVYAAPSDDFRF